MTEATRSKGMSVCLVGVTSSPRRSCSDPLGAAGTFEEDKLVPSSEFFTGVPVHPHNNATDLCMRSLSRRGAGGRSS